ncbi:hypothetical protein SAMN05444338_1274 [Flavobacterium degerlachei]|jgi:hypothetical protein|uniref:Uncharacterized protein n=1 Tax=Flavobacterium degerlachei TaxID=229203 RepID=A0A1H3GRT8_9FLAO|nr:hypothetical protein SAMN05444338_1274 [Flavobacterium degerlachei]
MKNTRNLEELMRILGCHLKLKRNEPKPKRYFKRSGGF